MLERNSGLQAMPKNSRKTGQLTQFAEVSCAYPATALLRFRVSDLRMRSTGLTSAHLYPKSIR